MKSKLTFEGKTVEIKVPKHIRIISQLVNDVLDQDSSFLNLFMRHPSNKPALDGQKLINAFYIHEGCKIYGKAITVVEYFQTEQAGILAEVELYTE
jgi:hypothetical protein